MQGLKNSGLPTLLQINFFYQNNCEKKGNSLFKKMLPYSELATLQDK